MFRSRHGSTLVEFALAVPVIIALVLPSIQLLRAALFQTRLEVLAFRVARRLAANATPPSDLSAAARTLTAGFRPAVTSHAVARTLTTLAAPYPRRPRTVEVVEVDLTAAGPLLFPGAPYRAHAHAREFRWGAS